MYTLILDVNLNNNMLANMCIVTIPLMLSFSVTYNMKKYFNDTFHSHNRREGLRRGRGREKEGLG